MMQTAHIATNFLNLNDPNAALGAVNAFSDLGRYTNSDLGRYTNKGGTLYVFALDEAR